MAEIAGTSGGSSCPTALLKQGQLELAAQSHGLLHTCTGEDTAASLGNICQYLTSLTEKGGFCLCVCLFLFQTGA